MDDGLNALWIKLFLFSEIDAVLFVEPTVEIGWDRIFLLF